MRPSYIGIDPGYQGAVAVLRPGAVPSYVHDLPVYEMKLRGRVVHEYDIEQMREQLEVEIDNVPGSPVRVVLEHVTRPAKLTRCQGIIEGLLVALGQSYVLVRPQVWKRDMGLSRGASKAASLVMARGLFPGLVHMLTLAKHDGRAEALLIAEWGRRHDVEHKALDAMKVARKTGPTDLR